MSSMKRVQLVVLLLIAAAFFAGTRALAAGFPTTKTGSAELTPVGDEPGASGHATLNASYLGKPYYAWFCSLSVSCEGLTPGVLYQVVLVAQPGDTDTYAYATANEDGRLVAKCSVWYRKGYFWLPRAVAVNRYQPPFGSVLNGTIVWR